MNSEQPNPRVRVVTPAESVPVYNCILYVRRNGKKTEARIANLSDSSFTAESEREVLQQAVKEFKRVLTEHSEKNEPVPLVDPPPPATDETVRYVAVHL